MQISPATCCFLVLTSQYSTLYLFLNNSTNVVTLTWMTCKKQAKLKLWIHLSLYLLQDLLSIYIIIFSTTLVLRYEHIQWNLDPPFLRGSAGANSKCIREMRKQKIKTFHLHLGLQNNKHIKRYVSYLCDNNFSPQKYVEDNCSLQNFTFQKKLHPFQF